MSFVKVSRAADIVYNYDKNGVARVPILVGECKDCALERVAIQPGCSWTPDVYKLEEHNQVFLFMTAAFGTVKINFAVVIHIVYRHPVRIAVSTYGRKHTPASAIKNFCSLF